MKRIAFLSISLFCCARLLAMDKIFDESFMREQEAKIAGAIARFTPKQRNHLEQIANPGSNHNKAVERIMGIIDSKNDVAHIRDLRDCFQKNGIPVDLDDFKLRGSALSYACWVGNALAASTLLKLKADPNFPGRKRSTPLIIVVDSYLRSSRGEHYAKPSELKDIFTNLLVHRADVTQKNAAGESAKSMIEKCENRDHLKEFKLLMTNQALAKIFNN